MIPYYINENDISYIMTYIYIYDMMHDCMYNIIIIKYKIHIYIYIMKLYQYDNMFVHSLTISSC